MPPKVISGGDNPYDIHDAKLSSSATAHESSSVTAHEISNIKALIEAENPKVPLSDNKLAEQLKKSGISVSRRAVTKYREQLSIPGSYDRKG